MKVKKDWACSFLLACGIHGLALVGIEIGMSQSAEFGMTPGANSVEVSLVAAPALPPLQPPPHEAPPLDPEPAKEPEMVLTESIPETPQEPQPMPPPKPKPTASSETARRGDGSSSLPGQDATTLQSSEGAPSETKPGYLKNPPPPYPENARRQRQEGAVLLTVRVNTEGEAETVEVKRSSSHPLLDDAAVKAVKRWRFRPSHIGGIPVASQADIPIRFVLEANPFESK